MKNLIFTLATIFCLFITVNAQTQIWGCAQNGGATGQGTIFSADGNGGNFQNQYSLVNATGAMPVGNCLHANNGKLYGVTYMGGCNDSCVCYMFDPITGTWTNFHDLYCDISHGWDGWGGMIQASDNNLYGLCSQGGANGFGVVYKVDPITNTYTDIHDLDSTNGINPYGSLVQLSDGKLYGMTRSGGAANYGVIFNFDPSNSTYTVLHSFDGTTAPRVEIRNMELLFKLRMANFME